MSDRPAPDVIAALITALHDADVGVRSSAASSLARLGQTSRKAESWSIRRDSVRFLGQIGGHPCVFEVPGHFEGTYQQ